MIHAQSSLRHGFGAWEKSIEESFSRFKDQYSFMQNKTLHNYFGYHAAKDAQATQRARWAPNFTPYQLWDAVCQLSPSVSTRLGSSHLRELLASEKFDLVPLGKVYGTHKLWLIPALGARPTIPLKESPNLGFAHTNCGAISYPDGHPSEGELITTVDTKDDEEKLRRFVALG